MAGEIKSIKPGSWVKVEIVKKPSSAAAGKTLIRLLAKDPGVAATKKKDKVFRARSRVPKDRGGRRWWHSVSMRQPVTPTVGVSGKLRATADVLQDLASVSRFVKVTAD